MKMKKRLLGILLSLALALGVSISLLSVSVFAEGEEVEETEEAVETVGDVIENETPEEVEEIVEVTGETEEEPGMSLTAYANGTPAYSGGTGTEADPYLISTADDWKALAGAVNDGEAYTGKYFRQTADLDMSGAGNLNPVGTLEHPFAGNYEGDGFAISNAAITGMACSFQGYNMNVAGLFGALVGSGSISNLKVTNVSVTATSGSGGWDQAYAGGLVAFAENCTITDCSVSNSTITAGNSNIFAGAFVGFAGAENSEKTAFSKCASENNTVNTYDYGGGFIGAIGNETSSNDAILFTDCYSAKNTADAGTHTYGTVGGFLGGSQGGDVTVRNGFVYGCSAVATGTGSGKGVFTGDTYYGTVQASNTYYYDTNNLPVNAESATAKTADEMKSLASTLGDAFTQGSNYPILLHPVNLAVSIEGWTYGEEAKEPSVTRNSSGTPTYTYADKGTTDFSATVPSNAGNYTVKATVEKTATHKAAEATADFTIAKAIPVITVPTPDAMTYDPAKTLANVTLPTDWAWKDSTIVPSVSNNGYEAEFTVSDYTNYDYSNVEGYNAETHKVIRTVTLTVNKANAVPATVTANNRTYDGTEKPLVTEDKSTLAGGTMQYALGTATEATQPYTTSIPTATDAGTYYVWYMVKGDDNHVDSAAACVTVTIDKAAPTFTAPKAKTGLVENGKAQELITAGTATGGTMLYALGKDDKTAPDASAFKEAIPSGTNAGTYYVWYMVKGDADHSDSEAACVTVTIEKESPAPSDKVQMYRLYNPNSGEHFYTSSKEEKEMLLKAGWTDEGDGFLAPVESKTPIYRLYNPNVGDHHYTSSTEERDMLVKAGWKAEGIGWYADDAEGMPMYRLYNPNAVTGTHHYTSSEEEQKHLISLGWVDEGIGFYACK